MKNLEEIEKEYENYTVDKPYIKNIIEFLAYIEIGLDKLVEDQDVMIKERRSLKIDRFMLNLMDFITFTAVEEDNDIHFLNADIKAVDKMIELSNYQAIYLARIAEVATFENYKELLKLVDFSCEYYNKNVEYIDYMRDVYDFQRKGINMFHGGKEDYSEVFNKFMQKQLAKYEKVQEKPVQKTKRI